MKVATSGKTIPTATYTLAIANQAVGAAACFTSAAIPLNNALVANSVMVASARSELPKTAGGVHGRLTARLTADNSAVIDLDNNGAAALVATAADIIIDVMALEVSP